MSRNVKILIVVLVLLLVVLPAIAMAVLFALAGAGGFVMYRFEKKADIQASQELMFMEVSMLAETVAEKQAAGEAVASCRSEQEATAALEQAPMVKHLPDRCLVDLGLDDEPEYGQYWVEVHPGGITVGGVQDNDGDGQIAKVVAAPGQSVKKLSPDGVY